MKPWSFPVLVNKEPVIPWGMLDTKAPHGFCQIHNENEGKQIAH